MCFSMVNHKSQTFFHIFEWITDGEYLDWLKQSFALCVPNKKGDYDDRQVFALLSMCGILACGGRFTEWNVTNQNGSWMLLIGVEFKARLKQMFDIKPTKSSSVSSMWRSKSVMWRNACLFIHIAIRMSHQFCAHTLRRLWHFIHNTILLALSLFTHKHMRAGKHIQTLKRHRHFLYIDSGRHTVKKFFGRCQSVYVCVLGGLCVYGWFFSVVLFFFGYLFHPRCHQILYP